MTSIHSSFGSLGNLSLTSNDSDLATGPYSSSAMKMVPRQVTPGMTIPGPLQLPRFVFPAKIPPAKPSAPQIYSKETARRPHSLIALHSNDPPNAKDPTTNDVRSSHLCNYNDSPPVSPRTQSVRSELCKRGTSEHTESEKMNNIPTILSGVPPKVEDSKLAAPATIGQRRGHAHRRSAAISTSDLSLILKPSYSYQTGGSLPSSPHTEPKNPILSKSFSSPSEFRLGHEKISEVLNSSSKTQKNTRVGFSDDIQIIPRPLSLDSCDSASILRPAHSVSNSITSIVSGSQLYTSGNDGQPTNLQSQDRPRTAEFASDEKRPKYSNHGPKRSGSFPIMFETTAGTLSDSSTPRSMKRWTFFGNDLTSGNSIPKSRPTSSTSSCHDQQRFDDNSCKLEEPNFDHGTSSREAVIARRSTVYKKSNKNKKRVKSWAGSILSHKTRQRNHKHSPSRNSQPLPKIFVTALKAETTDTVDQSSESLSFRPENDFIEWKPCNLPLQDEPMSPVIDLDAALGPFNTPTPNFGESWDISQRGGTRKRFMHSAASLGGFTGPGMHYHRRSESAPEFENPRFGFHRLGSSSTMAMEDVFEEDEDEEWEDTKSSTKDDSSKTGVNIDNMGLETTNNTQGDKSNLPPEYAANITIKSYETQFSHDSSDIVTNETFIFRKSECNAPSGIIVVDGITGVSSKTHERTTSRKGLDVPMSVSITLEKPKREENHGTESQSVLLELPSPSSGLNAATKTALPSPMSSFSNDTQTISTAPPSINNDHEFELLLLGEPGPELRISVDEVPSLTSSDSASSVSLPNGENMSNNNFPEARSRIGQRPASFSATVASRKRSSIASLSRLISSSHGERSKLAFESRAPSYSEVENSQKSGHLGKRISRLIKFWKKSDFST
ncbi:putative cell wall proline rich protein [Golovinomyces cichoracearum]|uniref:Putative cell wall proline rich protein n=1 Tax=Golovinomyces cichoracearum TaxID=62708 RepID=A0A420J5Y6_9PEZI|nr:putative cell wall proline rich protein [Golovinomyces cichoracearum]